MRRPFVLDTADRPAVNDGDPSAGRVLRDRFWIAGPIGLLLAFFWQPALRLVPPFVLTSVSSLLVLALILFERGSNIRRRRVSVACYLLCAILAALGVGEAGYYAVAALGVSDANDRRCLQIEVRLLSGAQDRAADAATFTALGCRPQSLSAMSWRPGSVGDAARSMGPSDRATRLPVNAEHLH